MQNDLEKNDSPNRDKTLKKRFRKFNEIVENLCKKNIELKEFIHEDFSKMETLDSAHNVFNVLKMKKFFDDPIYFQCFTSSCLKILRSTCIACPQLSVSLIQ